MTWSPDGKTLVSGGRDGALRFWDGAQVEQVMSRKRAQGGVVRVAWSPDGKTVASCGYDSMVRLWDIENESAKEPKAFPADLPLDHGFGLVARTADTWHREAAT